MSWEDNHFPNADDPNDAEWMIMYWRTVPCPTGKCKGQDYRLESRQFDHLPKGTTLKEARAKLAEYVDQRKHSPNPRRKNHSLFLCKVIDVEHISEVTNG